MVRRLTCGVHGQFAAFPRTIIRRAAFLAAVSTAAVSSAAGAGAGAAAGGGGEGGVAAGPAADGAAAVKNPEGTVGVSAGPLKGLHSRPSSLVNITTEAAMHDRDGRVIRDCFEPHITKFGDTYYAYGYAGGNASDPAPYATTCYSSQDLSVWVRQSSFPMVNGTAGGQPNIWWYVSVLYNNKTDEYVAYGGGYGHLTDRYQAYTSKSPTGPFVYRRTLSAVFGGPGDTTFFADDDGKAYLAYNAADPVVPFDTVSRFTYVYQLREDYLDIVSSTLCNTSVSMEGLWLMKNQDTYYLLGSGLVNYDDDDDFYLTAPTPLGPWTPRGFIAPVGSRTFHSQTFHGLTVRGSMGVAHVFIGARWCNPPVINATCDHAQAGNFSTWCCWPPFDDAISIWLPLSFAANGSLIPMQWEDHWMLDTDGQAFARH